MPNSMDAPSRNPTWHFKILLLNDVFMLLTSKTDKMQLPCLISRVEPPAFPCFFVCCLDLISHGENPCNLSFNDGIPRFDGEIPVSVGYNKSAGILI